MRLHTEVLDVHVHAYKVNQKVRCFLLQQSNLSQIL